MQEFKINPADIPKNVQKDFIESNKLLTPTHQNSENQFIKVHQRKESQKIKIKLMGNRERKDI